jgi:hypothetical protein
MPARVCALRHALTRTSGPRGARTPVYRLCASCALGAERFSALRSVGWAPSERFERAGPQALHEQYQARAKWLREHVASEYSAPPDEAAA